MATIWSAIASKDPKQLEALIKAGGDVNMVGGGDQTPLHLACLQGRIETAMQLLELGASVDAQDVRGRRLMHQIIMKLRSDKVLGDMEADSETLESLLLERLPGAS